ncbi:hypothetical protein Tco_1369576 [Tanacetum coccineum]
MNTLSEETPRVKSSGSAGSSGGKNRRRITTSGKSSGEEVNSIPNYLRTSTGSCHDFWSNAGIEKKEIKTVKKLIPKGLDSCVLGYGTRYFESKGGGGRGVKEKQHGSTNANVVSSAIDEPSTTAPINSGNKNGTEEGNIGGIPSPANDENLNDVGTTAPRCVLVGSKVEFKPVKQAYRPVSTKHAANTSGSKKNDVEPTKKVSNSNPFNVLNSVEYDMDLGTNRGLQTFK